LRGKRKIIFDIMGKLLTAQLSAIFVAEAFFQKRIITVYEFANRSHVSLHKTVVLNLLLEDTFLT